MDRLRMDYINSLPQPFTAHLYCGSVWPVYDIDVETGLLRIDVCGKLEAKHVSDVREFIDTDGGGHDPDSFYLEACRCGGEGTIQVELQPYPNDISPVTETRPCPECAE